MKKIICSVILFCALSYVNAQNVVSITFQPTDLGYGLRYDHLFEDFGLYAGVTKGEYRFDDSYIKDHYKVSLGGTIPCQYSYLSGGLCYNRYGERFGDFELRPFSFDLGCGVILGRINVAFRMDFLKGEGCIELGVVL